MNVYGRIKELCDQKGIAVTALEKELGFGRGSIGKLKTRNTTAGRLKQIADYFGVPVEYFMNGEEQHEQIDPDFIFLKESFSKLSQDDKNEILGLISIKLENQRRKKGDISA